MKYFSPYFNIFTQVFFYTLKNKNIVLFTSTCDIIYLSVFARQEFQNMPFT